MMKILYLAPSSKRPDQVLRYSHMEEELHALADRGIDVYVLSTEASHDYDQGHVHVRSLSARTSLRERLKSIWFLARHIKTVPLANLRNWRKVLHTANIERVAADLIHEQDIDIIHSAFGWPCGFAGVMARAATGRPLVASLLGSDLNVLPDVNYGMRLDPFFDCAMRSALGQADRTIYVSHFLCRQGVRLGAPPDRTEVVRIGVDINHFSPPEEREAIRRDLAFDERPVILTVAGLIPVKGVHLVLEALGRLRATHDFRFLVCGEGNDLPHLQSLARRLGIEDRTEFLGRVGRTQIQKYFAASDIFVLSSLVEGSGNVLLEAMASGCPVVCSDAGGPSEYVQHGVAGFVVPVRDSEAIAVKVAHLLDDPTLRERMGQEGRRAVAQRFTYLRHVEHLIDVYKDVLNEPRTISLPRKPLLHAGRA